MTQTYRTTDLTKWGAGIGVNLTPTQMDINFWDIIQRIETQEARPDPSAGIDHFSISGTSLYVHMTDTTIRGPYTLPTAFFNARGEWAPSTEYSVLDTFTINGGLYSVIFAHTSALTFNPYENDGSGHDYYALMIQTPGSSLPTGGAVAQVLQKSTTTDYATTWGWKLPEDGNTGQFLKKQSNANQDADWDTPLASEIDFVPATGSLITSDNLADVAEELSSGTAIDASGIPFTPATGTGLASDNIEDVINEIAESSGGGIGRQTIWIPASAMTPLSTNGAAVGSVELSTSNTMLKSLDFDSNISEKAQFEIAMPKSWDGGDVFFRAFWSHPTTTTNFGVWWEIGTSVIGDAGNLDVTPSGYSGVADTGGVTDYLFVSDESAALVITAAYGDLIFFRIDRYPADSSDTLAVDARLHGIQLIYTTNASTDD